MLGSASVVIESDADGTFHAVLPASSERWRVEVSKSPVHAVRVVDLVVRDGEARLDLELPDTRLEGRVVDSAGVPVERATVDVGLADGGGTNLVTNADGHFEVAGFEPGAVAVSATDRDHRRSSQVETLDVAAGRSVPPVELRLVETRQLQGNVLGAFGPVPGALVALRGAERDGSFATVARSDQNGHLTVDVPASATRMDVTVLAPGLALDVVEVPADRDFVLRPPSDGGTLTVEWPALPPEAGTPILLKDGHLLDYRWLMDWARGNGGSAAYPIAAAHPTWAVPRVAVGQYQLCWVRSADLTRAMLGGGGLMEALSNCAGGYLSPGSELRLSPVAK